MLTRFLIAGVYFFGTAAAAAIAIATLAPMDAIRFLGVVAFACAGAGLLLQLHALRLIDPDAYGTLALRFRAAAQPLRALFASVASGAADSGSSTHSAR
jgi:hypothetical protein